MQINGTSIVDTYAEAFRMWCARVIITADDEHWAQTAAMEFTGYGTSIIGCDAEAGTESVLGGSGREAHPERHQHRCPQADQGHEEGRATTSSAVGR